MATGSGKNFAASRIAGEKKAAIIDLKEGKNFARDFSLPSVSTVTNGVISGSVINQFGLSAYRLGEPRYKKNGKKGDIVPFRRPPPLNG